MNKNDRFKTILVIVTGLLAFAYIFDIQLLAQAALLIGILSVFIPIAARAIEWIWMKIALLLGWTNSKVILSVVYFGFLMPIAMVSRFFTRDPLSIRGKDVPSLFVNRNHSFHKEDLDNIW
jgi:hypothetical protein